MINVEKIKTLLSLLGNNAAEPPDVIAAKLIIYLREYYRIQRKETTVNKSGQYWIETQGVSKCEEELKNFIQKFREEKKEFLEEARKKSIWKYSLFKLLYVNDREVIREIIFPDFRKLLDTQP